MTIPLDTTARRTAALALLLIGMVLVGGTDLAWACDPDPSDWEAGLEACREWQRELDRGAWQRWLALVVPALVLLPIAPRLVRRIRG